MMNATMQLQAFATFYHHFLTFKMVKLNKSTRYALYALVELSREPETIVSVKQIAEKYKISEHHVVKVLQKLVRAGMIRSVRGLNGGFQIAQSPKTITMLDVIEIFEPRAPRQGCALLENLKTCELKGACRIGEVLEEIQEQAYFTLKSVSIATLISPKKFS
ncbi:Rrf2 family transcriptional regulator [candidate division KSB1 bacterium]|nr:Rrf2 family transcriptional regulator [candidate division KSB1 bacterium]